MCNMYLRSADYSVLFLLTYIWSTYLPSLVLLLLNGVSVQESDLRSSSSTDSMVE